jgi:ferredoxin
VKPKIDHNLCTGDAICVDICPEVFELRDDGLAYVIDDDPDPSLDDAIRDAVDSCPAEAISIEE